MNHALTLGSLFDGSGGFPLGALMTGIKPVWASEIEPFPIRVTTKRLPFMQHLGDISKIKGDEIEPVDIITFGSPCQDMSIAGKRDGLGGSRSSLFYEAIRIIKEMRDKTDGEYPRYIIWENVPGAFSSNKGEDFRSVLEEICRVKYPSVSIPISEKWQRAGLIMEDDFSLAWRLLDAQYWGVPQRRKRIYLVADFTGSSAGKVLFESEGLSGNPSQSFSERKETPGCIAEGSGKTVDVCLNDQGGNRMDVTHGYTSTLRAESNHPPLVFQNHAQDGRYDGPLPTADTVVSRYGTGGNNVQIVVDTPKLLKIRQGHTGQGGRGPLIQDNKSATLSTLNEQTLFVPTAFGISAKESNGMNSPNPHSGVYEAATARCLDENGGNPSCNQGGIAIVETPAFGIGRDAVNQGKNSKFGITIDENVEPPILSTGPSSVAAPTWSTSKASFFTSASEEKTGALVATDYKDPPIVNDESETTYIVRRLTPTECARLQGFPDWWCSHLGTDNPTPEDILTWKAIFQEHAAVMGKTTKEKSDKQIIKWLKDPHSDSAEYKMWGNGVALPCVIHVLGGISFFANET